MWITKVPIGVAAGYLVWKWNWLPRLGGVCHLPNGDLVLTVPIDFNDKLPAFMNNLDHKPTLNRGDLVRFMSPRNPETVWCTAVTGLPGDVVGREEDDNQQMVLPGNVWLEGGHEGEFGHDSRRLGQIPMGLITERVGMKIWPLTKFSSPATLADLSVAHREATRPTQDIPLNLWKNVPSPTSFATQQKEKETGSSSSQDEIRFAFEISKGDNTVSHERNEQKDGEVEETRQLTVDDLYKIIFPQNKNDEDESNNSNTPTDRDAAEHMLQHMDNLKPPIQKDHNITYTSNIGVDTPVNQQKLVDQSVEKGLLASDIETEGDSMNLLSINNQSQQKNKAAEDNERSSGSLSEKQEFAKHDPHIIKAVESKPEEMSETVEVLETSKSTQYDLEPLEDLVKKSLGNMSEYLPKLTTYENDEENDEENLTALSFKKGIMPDNGVITDSKVNQEIDDSKQEQENKRLLVIIQNESPDVTVTDNGKQLNQTTIVNKKDYIKPTTEFVKTESSDRLPVRQSDAASLTFMKDKSESLKFNVKAVECGSIERMNYSNLNVDKKDEGLIKVDSEQNKHLLAHCQQNLEEKVSVDATKANEQRNLEKKEPVDMTKTNEKQNLEKHKSVDATKLIDKQHLEKTESVEATKTNKQNSSEDEGFEYVWNK